MNNKKILVIIPARGGSKRIIKKNIKKICGQPMIFWPLYELSKNFKSNEILISSDDDEIIALIESIGLEVPFKRPENLADDFTGTVPVSSHALDWYEKNVKKVDYVLIVYPTAILLNIEDINSSLKILEQDKKCDLVFSACKFPYPIQRAVYLNDKGYAKMFQPDHYSSRSQDLQVAWQDAGQFYLYRSKSLRSEKNIKNANVKLKILSKNMVIDIDDEEDFTLAESKLKHLEKDKVKMNFKFKN